MSCINTRSNRGAQFYMPYSEEGKKLTLIPVPVAIKREPAGGKLVHECNPQLLVFTDDAKAGAIAVEQHDNLQPGSMLIVETGNAAQTVAGVECAVNSTTVLVWTGKAYLTLGGGGSVTVPGKATAEADGLMSKEDKAKLDGLEEQVQADWNATSGVASIKNKPTIPVVPTNATTAKAGLVKQAAAVANPADNADAAAIVTSLKSLLSNLRAAGVLANS